jgi:peptidoglycan/LPS O-acetylase OafA/YrhL
MTISADVVPSPTALGADMPPPPRERRHELDALRVLAVLALLLYHASRPFDSEVWHVKDIGRSLGLELFGNLLTPWRLPLLFMISGLGTYYALGFRSAWRYAADRVRRLLLPLAFGMAVVVVPQVYVERISVGMPDRMSPRDFQGSYLDFYPHYFEGVYPGGNFSWHHLWFLAYLLVFSLAALPLFLYLRGEGGQRLVTRLASWLRPGRRIFLLALPLALIHVALRGRFPSTHALVGDWWNVAHYAVLFLLGYVLLPQPAFRAAVEANRRVGAVLFVTAFALRLALVPLLAPIAPYSIAYAGLLTLRAIIEWSALVAVIGYAGVYLSRPSRVLRYGGERVYPFYIWHQTVIVVIAYFVVGWATGPLVKFAAISAISLLVTMALCEAVALTPLTRLLFGMKS